MTNIKILSDMVIQCSKWTEYSHLTLEISLGFCALDYFCLYSEAALIYAFIRE